MLYSIMNSGISPSINKIFLYTGKRGRPRRYYVRGSNGHEVDQRIPALTHYCPVCNNQLIHDSGIFFYCEWGDSGRGNHPKYYKVEGVQFVPVPPEVNPTEWFINACESALKRATKPKKIALITEKMNLAKEQARNGT